MQDAARMIEERESTDLAGVALPAPPRAPLAMPVQDLGSDRPSAWNRARSWLSRNPVA